MSTHSSNEHDRRPLFELGAGVQGDELERLLAPVGVQMFVAEYWGRQALYIKGRADKYAGVFDRDAFDVALRAGAQAAPGSGFSVRARFDRRRPQGELIPELPIAPASVNDALRAGATICVNAISVGSESLRAFAQAVKAQLSYPGPVRFNAYLSPHGCGARTHFDARVATTLQIAGRKMWRFSRAPAVSWPRGNGLYNSDGSGSYHFVGQGDETWEQIPIMAEADFQEVTLEPGDFLCLPAGTWHSCDADGESLALNLAFEPTSPMDILADAIKPALLREPSWRSAAPFASPQGRSGELPNELDAYLDRKIDEATSALQALKRDRFALRNAWMRWTTAASTGAAPRRRPTRDEAATRQVEADDVLCIARTKALVWTRGHDADGNELVSLWAGDTRVDVTGPHLAMLVQRVLSARRFRAGDCADWLPRGADLRWEDVRETLDELLRSGVLELA